MKYLICWYDPYDGKRDYTLREFDTVQEAAKAAGQSTLQYGVDMSFDIVDSKTRRVIKDWQKFVPDLERY